MSNMSNTNNGATERTSRKPRKVAAGWTELQKLVGHNVTVKVESLNTNREGRVFGLNIESHGIKGFLPGSEQPRGTDQAALVGQELEVKILEADPHKKGGRLLVSRKAVVAEAQRAFIASLEKGQEVEGTVLSVAELKEGTGYFVAVGPCQALLHSMQIPRRNGEIPTLAVGETVKARVLGKSEEACKVSLTMRAPRSEQHNGRRNDRKGRGNGPRQSRTQDAGANGTGRTSTPPPAKAKETRVQPTSTSRPPKKVKRPATPAANRKGERKFTDLQEFCAWWKENNGGEAPATDATETTATPAAVETAAEPTTEATTN
jgi:predicted RNA-binding protein with RPS1 domain